MNTGDISESNILLSRGLQLVAEDWLFRTVQCSCFLSKTYWYKKGQWTLCSKKKQAKVVQKLRIENNMLQNSELQFTVVFTVLQGILVPSH